MVHIIIISASGIEEQSQDVESVFTWMQYALEISAKAGKG